MSSNRNAITILEQNLHKLNTQAWCNLCENPNAIHILEHNLDKLNDKAWINLSKNPPTIHILEQNHTKQINRNIWYGLCDNPNAIYIIEQNFDKVQTLDLNIHLYLLHMMKKNAQKASSCDRDNPAFQEKCISSKNKLLNEFTNGINTLFSNTNASNYFFIFVLFLADDFNDDINMSQKSMQSYQSQNSSGCYPGWEKCREYVIS